MALWLRPKRRDLIAMSIVLIGGVFAQVIIGAIVVLTGLNPYSNIAHFIVSIFLMTVAYMLVRHAQIFRHTEEITPRAEPLLGKSPISMLVKILLIVTGVVVLTGTIVTGSGPHAGDEKAVRLGFSMTEVVRVHSTFVWLTLAIVVLLSIWVQRIDMAKRLLTKSTRRFIFALLFQGVVGYLQYFLGVPIWLVAIHVATSVAVWLLAVDIYWNSRLSVVPQTVLD